MWRIGISYSIRYSWVDWKEERNMKFSIVIVTLFLILSCSTQKTLNASSVKELVLYPSSIPGAIESEDFESISNPHEKNRFLVDVTFPKLTAFFPTQSNANTAAVIILPGGGYTGLSIDWEGFAVAQRFNQIGVTAFVLKYRIPTEETMENKSVGPLQDLQQAIHLVRSRSQEWGLDPTKIGVMGFSAGGHLASSAAVHFDHAVNSQHKVKNLRPDFQIQLYPVISFDKDITHSGSRENLIGLTPDASLIQHYSNDLQVTVDTPQAFIVHAKDDNLVPVANALRYHQALQNKGVPSQILLLPSGGHGFGLHNDYDWFADLTQWMVKTKILNPQ